MRKLKVIDKSFVTIRLCNQTYHFVVWAYSSDPRIVKERLCDCIDSVAKQVPNLEG